MSYVFNSLPLARNLRLPSVSQGSLPGAALPRGPVPCFHTESGRASQTLIPLKSVRAKSHLSCFPEGAVSVEHSKAYLTRISQTWLFQAHPHPPVNMTSETKLSLQLDWSRLQSRRWAWVPGWVLHWPHLQIINKLDGVFLEPEHVSLLVSPALMFETV